MKKTLILLFCFYIISSAQIDTNIVMPLEIGTYWEYSNYSDIHYYKKVIDTVKMENGKTYSKIMSVNLINDENQYWDTSYVHLRRESEIIYYIGSKQERVFYDFSVKPGEIFVYSNRGSLYRGYKLTDKSRYFSSMFQDTLTYYFFERVDIDSNQNPPDTNIVTDLYYELAKGIGETYSVNNIRLIGAIINGKEYGHITGGVQDEQPLKNKYEIHLASYPNPFNGICNIVVNIPVSQKVSVKLYNILGEDIKQIYNAVLSGQKTIPLIMPSGLSSGTYLLLLRTNKKVYTNKIVYLK